MAGDDEQAIIPDEADDNARAELTVTATTSTTVESFHGPLPPPRTIEEYERILPGAADRIFTMAEKQAAHRHEMESAAMALSNIDVRSAYQRANRGLHLAAIVAFAIVAGGVCMAFLGHASEGAGVIGGTIVGLATVFIYGARMRDRKAEPGQETSE